MAADSMQTHLQRLQEIMAKSATAPTTKASPSVIPQKSSMGQSRVIEAPMFSDWRPALKYVTRHLAQHPEVETSVRKVRARINDKQGVETKLTLKMIVEHRQHERQWWAQREKKTIKSELDEYDIKVYKAQKGMHEYMAKQLHALGIPFFAPTPTHAPGERLLELQRQMLEHLESAYGPD